MEEEVSSRETFQNLLSPYGIEVTDELWERYWKDTLVYSLMNIMKAQQEAQAVVLREAFEAGRRAALDALERKFGLEH